MNEHEFALELGLPEETVKALDAISLSPEEAEARCLQFLQNPDGFEAWGRQQPGGLAVLKVYLRLLPLVRKAYADLSIPEEIFREGCQDIGIWCRDYLALHGEPGLDRWGWISLTLRLRLFRLGRLQFEPSRLSHDIRAGGRVYPAGTPHLEVHIPAEDPLEPAQVQASLNRAIPFFREYFGTEYRLFHCHSWLLAPELRELLPADSRILQFQSLFTVYARDPERQAEERVFGKILEDPALYPADTSLRRRLRQYLLEGHSLGTALGFRDAEEGQR